MQGECFGVGAFAAASLLFGVFKHTVPERERERGSLPLPTLQLMNKGYGSNELYFHKRPHGTHSRFRCTRTPRLQGWRNSQEDSFLSIVIASSLFLSFLEKLKSIQNIRLFHIDYIHHA